MVFDLKKCTALLIFSIFYAKRPVKIDWVKNSKFRKLTFFGIIILHIFPNFDDDCMKTLRGVCGNHSICLHSKGPFSQWLMIQYSIKQIKSNNYFVEKTH